MIRAEPDRSLTALADRLESRARDLAEAHAQQQRLARRRDARRWRRAALLWPLFTKG